MQWAAGLELSGPAPETAGWDPGLSTDQRTAGIRGAGTEGSGSGLGDGRGLHWLWTCQDELAEVLGAGEGGGSASVKGTGGDLDPGYETEGC